MTKKLLQISNDFADQKIYVNLVRHLSEKGIRQVIYVPVRWEEKIDGNRDDTIQNVEYHYSYILKRNLLFKLRFHRKISIILKDLENKVNLQDIGLVHAHFLFSDGAVAYHLKKKYNIPYVVSVRATDIHIFFRYMLHLRLLGNRIIKEADKVIFINYSYRDIFNKKYRMSFLDDESNKFRVIANAIDDAWFQGPNVKKQFQGPVHLIYVGRIIKRKKLDVVIKSLKKLNRETNNRFRLNVVGDGEYIDKVKRLADDSVTFHGKINTIQELKRIYNQSHIFVMPAIRETFGLVYVEAMSQGLPVVFCKGEAIDGFFENDSIGRAVKPNSTHEVYEAVLSILAEYEHLSTTAFAASREFNWMEITEKYVEVYKPSFSRT